MRPYDSASRWGGDEFLILLPEMDLDKLRVFGERIRARIAEECRLEASDMGTRNLHVSVGAYLCHPDEDIDGMLHMADMALYAAKTAGRNRVSYIEATPGTPAA
jgi:diguanylate cyclase (GGDEF)-like protein